MTEGRDLRQTGDRIEQLLADVRSMISPPAWERVDELMRRVVDLYGTALGRMVALLGENGSPDVRARLLQDDLLASLLLLHGLHPEDFAARVQRALARVRPYLGSHGGGIELVEADAPTGVVCLRMEGSCDGCPSSAMTIKLAVESAIHELAPEVTRIDVRGAITPAERRPSSDMAVPQRTATASVPTLPPNGTAPAWTSLAEASRLAPGGLTACDVPGGRIVLCRVGQTLYAYRDACAACGAEIARGGLDGPVLTCPTCGQRYDVRRAGRSLDGRTLHLDPLPLLQDGAAVQVAVAGAAP